LSVPSLSPSGYNDRSFPPFLEPASDGRTLVTARAWLLALLCLPVPALSYAEPPRTVAEASDYKATSRHADVIDFCERLAKESPVVRLGTLGTSHEGRKLPLLIVADPPVASAAEAQKSKKLVVFAMGNIHAGEVDGKEALLMLARDVATAKERLLLKDLVLVFAPIFNADGNEQIDKANRREQAGPADGVGIRANAQGFDLNRDFVKLESPEVRALVRFFNQWDPAVFIDCHTTNGSYHRYTLTYEGGGCPAGDPRVAGLLRDALLADAGRRLEKETGFRSYYYGNFSADRSRWETVPPTPRYGIHYVALRNRIAVLSESYSYAPFKDRVLASRGFVKAICEHAAENKDKLAKLLSDVRDDTTRAGRQPKPADKIVLRSNAAPLGRPHQLLGFVEEVKDGKRVSTGQPKEYEVQYMGGAEPTLSVTRPAAYLLPAGLTAVVENLQRHGLALEELREDVELDVETYRIDNVTRQRDFQKHQTEVLDATARKESRRVEAGTVLVRTAQPLGSLAAYLLEPQSADGLATWNFFDAVLKEGGDFPVLRLPAIPPVTVGRLRPLPEDRTLNKPITFEMLYGGPPGQRPNFSGTPVSGLTWLDDEHFLQRKDGKLYKVQALTGRCQPYLDTDKVTAALAALPTISRQAAGNLAETVSANLNPQRTGALLVHASDLYYCPLDGGKAVRLTKAPGRKEVATFSPDGRFVAHVRDGNLYVTDVATQTERALTSDGSAVVSSGRADWVYGEEIFDRSPRAYWWSPDSQRIAFLRFDDTPVHKFTVVNPIPTRQDVETTPYPKAGQANPLVKLGLVSVAGGPVQWADLGNYSETGSLLIRAGWWPEGENAYLYVQDRAQTWLDFCTVSPAGEVKRLFRETTKAWVDDPGAPVFLKDGSFLLASARSGWNHLYHFDRDGKLKGPVTSGEWEVTNGPFQSHPVERVDEKGGWVYFTAKKDSPIATSLYRVKLDGSGLERLTRDSGDHRVSVNPSGSLFIDSWSSHAEPTKVRLCRADGTAARTLDTNPVHVREEYRTGTYELVRFKAPDGFVLDGSLLKPPGFDPKRRYPVWMMTYGGPHMPQVHDSWGGGRLHDEMLAQMGFVVFHIDPRSATDQSHNSTWAAYKRLGVQELKDLETAAKWVTGHPWADAARVGLSGGSYGGFMTAYALTHSKLFAAGVATAAVTDWRNYDSIYTERYMNTPQENKEGYDATSVVKAARDLHGRLLIVHGVMDDNVHVQNALQLVEALQRADKDFEVMIYPRARHGGFTPRHYQRLVIDFMKRTLRPGE
jgi:dipeptidyl aminopeptidase/acylaminoacyl peptidase